MISPVPEALAIAAATLDLEQLLHQEAAGVAIPGVVVRLVEPLTAAGGTS